MSSITNVPYAVKSMNGIIIIDDGAGSTIENGVVSCLELDVPRINVDQIESRTNGANVSMFTELVSGSVHLGVNTTTIYLDSATIASSSLSVPFISNVSMNSSLINVSTVNISSVEIGTENVSTLNASTITTNNIVAVNSSSTANLYTNVSTGIINIGTNMNTLSTINIGKASLVDFSQSTINSAGGINASNLFCDNFRHEVYGTNVSLLLEEFGPGATIQMGNVSNRLIIYAPTTIVDSLKVQTIISPNPTILSDLFANNTSGNVSIATGLTTGILTMGGTGVVNIKGSSINISTLNTSSLNVSSLVTNTITSTNTSSNAVIYNNITTGSVQLAMNTSSITIGANATKVAIGLNASVEMAGLQINGAEIRTIGFGSALTIGGSNMSTTQIVAVGTAQNDVYLGSVAVGAKVFVGDFKFTDDTMNIMIGSVPNVSGTMKIGDALTAGSLQLGTSLTTGNVSIGNGTTTGNINIRTTGSLLLANSASSIELGTGASVTNNINLGNVSTTINVSGTTLNIGNSPIRANTLNLGNVSTTFIVNCSSANISSRFVTMGAIAVTVNIGTQTQTANNITLGNVSTNLNFNASTISIGTTVNSNAITIGNISTVQFGIKAPINPDYDTKYVADVGTPSGCIGNYFSPTYSAPSGLTTNIANQTAIFINLPIGVWQINWLQTMNATTSVVITTLTMNIGSVTNGSDFLTNIVETNRTLAAGSARMYSTTYTFVNLLATNDVFCSVISTFTGTFLRGSNNIDTFKIIRLA